MEQPAQYPDAASRRILFGTDEPLPGSLPLRAGPLTLALRGGAIHDLRWDGWPVADAVTLPYRDADWWTPPSAAEAPSREERGGGFRVEVRGAFATAPPLRTRFAAAADAEGRLRVEAEAVPDGDLPTNRTGLCLVLPTAAGGNRIEVEHEDGRVTRSTIPTLVPPWPPFTAIRAMRWRLAPGCWARCRFEGESFEFEDQRNNADLSFKVYSRSNMMPRPYRLDAGVPVRQALALSVEGAPRSRRPTRANVAARDAEPGRPLPRLGLAIGLGGPDADLRRRAATGQSPSFLHATVEAADLSAAAPALASLVGEAGAPLHLDVALDDRGLADVDLAALGILRPEAVTLFPSPPQAVAAVRRALPGVPVGGGTPYFFAQINRLEGLGPVDFLSFTVSPLVHGAADDDVMRSPETLPGLVATLRHRWPGLPIHLGPSAIAMRGSPLGRMPPCDGRTRRAMAGDDPRARGLFAAAWALAMVARAAGAGVEALTLMAVDGPSGVAARREDGWVESHPVAAVLARLGRPAEVVPPPVAPALEVAALAFRRDGLRRMLLANLGGETVEAELRDWAVGAECAVLDERAVLERRERDDSPGFRPRPAARRVILGPYAVADLKEGYA